MSHLTPRGTHLVIGGFDLSGGGTYSYAPCCGTYEISVNIAQIGRTEEVPTI